jgi:hypothetical protein
MLTGELTSSELEGSTRSIPDSRWLRDDELTAGVDDDVIITF